MSNVLSASAARWLGDHHGVATIAELRTLGLGRKAVERLCALGVLARIERGVYVVTTAPPSLEHRCRRLCCLHPGGFITGPTAAILAGLRRQPQTSALHFSVRHGVHLHHVEGVRFRQSTKVRAADRWLRPDGIVVASWPRLAFDLAADLAPLDHRSVIHQLRDRRLVSTDQLIGIGRWLVHPARRGSETFELSMMDLGEPPHDSHPELLVADALLRRAVPVEPQVPVVLADGRRIHLDLGVPGVRWGVELDIHPEHRSVEGAGRDAGRARWLHGQDWQIEPVAELDLTRLDALADQLAALYQRRAAALARPRVPADPTGVAGDSGALAHSGGVAGSGVIDSAA